MPYQNNNNRLVPKAIEDRNLKPAATATDKTIHYSVDTTGANKWTNTANALASLGKGLMEMDTLFHYQSQENAIKAIWETEQQGGNKKDWSEVSKRIKGAGVFNPYNDNAFRELQAQDIYRAAALEISSHPELEKMDEGAFHKLVSDTNKKMIEAFKQTGLSPKDYGTALVQWNKQVNDLTSKYFVENKKYQFDQLNIKETSDTTFQIEAALMDAEEGTEAATFRTVLENKIEHLGNDTGIVASDTQAKVIIGGIKNYIARNAGQIDDAEILAAVTDLKLSDGKSLSEVVPNYDIMVKDLLAQAREANLRQMKLEVEVKDFQQQQKVKEVMTDFMQKYTKGELSSPNEMQMYAKEMVNKYDLDGINSMKMFQEMAAGRKTWADLAEVETDPRVAAQLGMKVIAGTATYDEITEAINNGTLNYKDGFHMLQNLQTREQKQQTAEAKKVTEHVKSARKEMLEGYHTGDTDIDAVLLDPDMQTAFQNKLIELEAKYQQDHDYKAFNDSLAKYKSAYRQYATEGEHNSYVTGMAAGFESLSRTPAISQNQWNKVDINKSTQALRKMGITHSNLGNKDKDVVIASKPSPQRKITVTNNGKTYTKNTRHTGYDLGGQNIYMGRPIYAPMNGTVVGVLPERQSGGMGNMVLVQCENGKFIKYMHLQAAGLPQLGQRVDTKNPIGHIGNTGAVENKAKGSLHVEFYDKNKQWITAYQFLEK